VALAREASFTGDIVEMENCYQHAEHYFRVMRTVRAPDEWSWPPRSSEGDEAMDTATVAANRP
jgi:hypothetical protein